MTNLNFNKIHRIKIRFLSSLSLSLLLLFSLAHGAFAEELTVPEEIKKDAAMTKEKKNKEDKEEKEEKMGKSDASISEGFTKPINNLESSESKTKNIPNTPQGSSPDTNQNSDKAIRGDNVEAAAEAAVTTGLPPISSGKETKKSNQGSEKDEKKEKQDKKEEKEKKNLSQLSHKKTVTEGFREIFFADNEQVSVSLSNRDINRVLVKGDKIQSVNGPAGLFVAKNDSLGALYVNAYGDTPFTIFVSTVKGHSFSLLAFPKSCYGKNIILVSTTPILDDQLDGSSYQKTLINLISNVINNELPDDVAALSVKKLKKTDFYHLATIKPIAAYSSDSYVVIVSEVQNKTKTAVNLKPSYFYRPGIKAVALSEPVLPPKETVLLYRVFLNSDGLSRN